MCYMDGSSIILFLYKFCYKFILVYKMSCEFFTYFPLYENIKTAENYPAVLVFNRNCLSQELSH